MSLEPSESAAKEDGIVDIEQFLSVDLRVGRIESAEPLPKSKKLLKLRVDLGPLGSRQILSGIAKFFSPEALVGRRIVVVANLKPATLAGELSEGMLLAASNEDDTILTLIDPGEIPLGCRVR